jgi:hypothetical protein
MSRVPFLVLLVACGGKDPVMIDAPQTGSDAPSCQAQSAIGNFYRRQPNPRFIPGNHTFTDGKIDMTVGDPDLRWDEASASWQLYFHTGHGTTFTDPSQILVIRHATSADLATWTLDDAASLQVSATAGAWDSINVETPSVVYNPDAAPDRRYLMLYSGAKGLFGHGKNFPGFAIGAAFSGDGQTFTRVPASESPHGEDGLVLTGADVYPGVLAALVSDPDVVYLGGTYHMWFSSFACSGTTTCDATTANGIGHATSSDGVHWTVAEAPVRSLLHQSADLTTGGDKPSVIYDDVHCKFELWLTSDVPSDVANQPANEGNMAGVWHATSNDGLSWTINYNGTRDLVWNSITPDAGEHLGLSRGADIAAKSTGRYMVYTGFDDQNVPPGFVVYDHSASPGYRPGVITLDLATRDAQ